MVLVFYTSLKENILYSGHHWFLVLIFHNDCQRRSHNKNEFLYAYLQGDQSNTAVFIWFLGKSDLSSVSVYCIVHWQVTFYKGLEIHTAMFNWSSCIWINILNS